MLHLYEPKSIKIYCVIQQKRKCILKYFHNRRMHRPHNYENKCQKLVGTFNCNFRKATKKPQYSITGLQSLPVCYKSDVGSDFIIIKPDVSVDVQTVWNMRSVCKAIYIYIYIFKCICFIEPTRTVDIVYAVQKTRLHQ